MMIIPVCLVYVVGVPALTVLALYAVRWAMRGSTGKRPRNPRRPPYTPGPRGFEVLPPDSTRRDP